MDPALDATLDALLKSQPALWRGRDRYHADASIPTGFASLDEALPAGGWCIGGVTELLPAQQGIGEVSLLLPGLKQITSQDQWAAFINPPHLPYAPALCNAGVRLDRLLIIDSKNDTDTLWAAEQVLRAGIFASVVTWVERTTAPRQRRLQLAAEAGKSWATVFRPQRAAREHSPVAARLQLDVVDAGLCLEFIKLRGGKAQCVIINPAEFDTSQGAEWPVPAQAATL